MKEIVLRTSSCNKSLLFNLIIISSDSLADISKHSHLQCLLFVQKVMGSIPARSIKRNAKNRALSIVFVLGVSITDVLGVRMRSSDLGLCFFATIASYA